MWFLIVAFTNGRDPQRDSKDAQPADTFRLPLLTWAKRQPLLPCI